MTSSCRTLKLSDVVATPSATEVFAPNPRKLFGTSPVMNAHHEPELLGSFAASAATSVREPGSVIRPTMMPMITAMKAVIANQSKVCTARRAALATWRRLAMELTMAVNTSGITATVSSLT